jgi:hypothetical protein
MIFSTKNLIPKLEDWNKEIQDFKGQGFHADTEFKEGVKYVTEKIIAVLQFADAENSQNEKPFLTMANEEQGLILYADEDLWGYIQELKNSDFSKFSLGDAAKMWLRLKEILKKEPKVL